MTVHLYQSSAPPAVQGHADRGLPSGRARPAPLAGAGRAELGTLLHRMGMTGEPMVEADVAALVAMVLPSFAGDAA